MLEEAEDLAREEAPTGREHGPRDLVAEADDCAVRWLGLDAFREGDDVKLALHPKGHAVLVLVSANKAGPYGTTTIKLSRAQVQKLKELVIEL